MSSKYRVMICDDSESERQRFYARQFDNFDIPDVFREDGRFIEEEPLDSVAKLYQKILKMRADGTLPDLILLDLFYKKSLPDVDRLEEEFVVELLAFKERFLKLKTKVLHHLEPTGIGLLQRIREVDRISPAELPVAVYTDKNFNFLPSDQFNLLYKLDAGTVNKDRDDDPLTQLSPSSEYFRILNTIESSRGNTTRWTSRVFISHGSSTEWKKLQTFLEGHAHRTTMELAQNPNNGLSVIEKLAAAADQCSHAVIVMTGDDWKDGAVSRVRENVMHEIGYFQGRLGRNRVVLLREEGVNIPSNLRGLVYLSFRLGEIGDVFEKLVPELT